MSQIGAMASDNYGTEEIIPTEVWKYILELHRKSEIIPPRLLALKSEDENQDEFFEKLVFSSLSMPRLVNKKFRDCCRQIISETGADRSPGLGFAQYACFYGYLNCLQYYVECNGFIDKNLPCFASTNGNLDLMKYLLQIGCNFTYALTGSAVANDPSFMKFILDNGGGFIGDFLGMAARANSLEAVKFAYEHGQQCESEVMCDAAKRGHLEIIKYATEHGCRWSEWVCHDAAKYGHLDCLQYVHEHGCPWWEAETMIVAAENGHLHCVKYLHDKGCSWDDDTCRRAMNKNQTHVVEYLHENGCPCKHTTENLSGSSRLWKNNYNQVNSK